MNKIIKLLHILRNPTFAKALLAGAAAGVEHNAVLASLKNEGFKTIVDIGANRGQFALSARAAFPEAAILSFEPLAGPASVFRRVFQGGPRVTLHELAIGPRDGQTLIHISRQDDSSSLLPISASQSALFPGTEEKEIQTVRIQPLSSVLGKRDLETPALLKMDVQGFEREALEGCRSLLPMFSFLYVECSFIELYQGQALAEEIISFLGQYRFVLRGIYNLTYSQDGIAIQGDFLFARGAPSGRGKSRAGEAPD